MAEPSGERQPLRRLGLVLGPVLLLATVILPPPGSLALEAWRVAGLGALMATWWVTESIPIPAVAFLPIPLLPVLGVGSVEEAAAPFANPVIFLFMGGFMLAQAMQRWNLHRRIAFGIIAWTGTPPRRLVAGFMVASAFLSMWVSNTAVAVMMLPIGVSVIQVVMGEADGDGGGTGDPAFPVALLLGIAYGASIGGTATLIGTPPNAFLAGFMAEEFDVQVGFGQWMLVGVPLALVLLPLTWVVVTRLAFHVDPRGPQLEPGALRAFREALGAIAAPEARTAWVFGATAVAWIARPILEGWVPGLSDAGIAMAATLVLFLLPAGGGNRGALLDWDWAKRIPWGILILFGGGLSLAAAISSSGLAEWIGGALQGAGRLPVLALMLLVSALLVFLTELTSNTASAAAFVPILAGLAVALGRDPLLLTVPAALGASCAFMLPVATPPNAIVFGTGYMRMGHMVKAGFFLNLAVIAVIPFLTFVLLRLFFGVAV
jgi:sodium-dependent dicarboxylate transporter 2/3/5